ncbi:two component transcriptional regulator [Roseivivax marinus]|uniref:Two component transcriptional regulator n=1 Tax=Roseivivax marinus TaxID=1379903 RepID=W4HJ24_9RHOB|nr:response regulator transcription factor [Roseivivax marinus]ETW12742.1 two component transcriptional regulator [Roseivivax marinus]UMA64706.1 response regulator transcription factor [Roseivivax marinus]SEL71884.1 two component transcriptional regulator, LuxR family [Roseivivax marinus]
MKHETLAPPSGRIRSVVVVDDHPLYSDALSAALNLAFPGCHVATAQTLSGALALLDEGADPDLVMFDLKLPDVTGISGFEALRARIPGTPILVISSLTSQPVVSALMEAGAAGFLPKDASAATLKSVLFDVSAGRKSLPKEYRGASPDSSGASGRTRLADLTPQQSRIMKLICAGKPNKQIAYELDLAEATVKAHITALLRRLGVQNRTQAAVMVEAAQSEAAAGDPDARAFLSS